MYELRAGYCLLRVPASGFREFSLSVVYIPMPKRRSLESVFGVGVEQTTKSKKTQNEHNALEA